MCFTAELHNLRRGPQAAQEKLELLLLICRDRGFALYLAWGMVLLGRVLLEQNRIEEGVRIIDQAFSIVEETGERTYEAELQRLKGQLFLARGDGDAEAEASFQKALQVARCQSARSWELRAAVSLGRLWRKQGKIAQASELLSGVHHWFTEGLDTLDLQEARALLEELKREELSGATGG